MNLAMYIYLCEVVGNVGWMLSALFFVSMVALAINLFAIWVQLVEHMDDYLSVSLRLLKITIPTFLAIFVIRSAVPSQKTMYAMAAAYYGEQAVKSETFQRLNGKAMQLLEVKIDELIGDKKKGE